MKHTVRILKKSKDGVLVKVLPNGNRLEVSWDVFNSQFNLVDNYYGDLKPEIKAHHDKIKSLGLTLVKYQSMSYSSDPKIKSEGLMGVQTYFTKLQDESGWTPLEIKNFIKGIMIGTIQVTPITDSESDEKLRGKLNMINSKSGIEANPNFGSKSTFADIPGFNKLKAMFK